LSALNAKTSAASQATVTRVLQQSGGLPQTLGTVVSVSPLPVFTGAAQTESPAAAAAIGLINLIALIAWV